MATRIVEGQKPYSGGTAIGIDSDKVISLLLREENNLIQLNDDNEIYTDLQLEANIQPTDDFPVGVTVGRVLQSDGWTQSGLMLNWKTTSGDYARWIYANDGKLYFDNGTGTWKNVYYSTEVDTLLQNLQTSINNTLVNDYQRRLTAGANITIDPTTNVISATGGGGGGGSGDVVGPAGAVDNDIALYNGTSGKIIKDSGVMLSDLQEKLIAGTNISIAADGKTISATGGGSGDVTGPGSSTDGHLAVFDGATGKVIKDGGAVPTVNNGTIKIKQNALVKGSFTLNQSTAEQTISLDAGFVPTNAASEGQVIMAATQGIGYYWASLGTAATKDTGTSSGNIPVLDSNGKLATSTLPGVALTDTFTVSTSSDLTNLTTAEQGDLAIVTTESKTYVLSQNPYSTAANWKEILSPTGGVTSVNGNTGAVTVTEFTPTSTGSTGNILTKTAGGYDWGTDRAINIFSIPTSSYATALGQLYASYMANAAPVMLYDGEYYHLDKVEYTSSPNTVDMYFTKVRSNAADTWEIKRIKAEGTWTSSHDDAVFSNITVITGPMVNISTQANNLLSTGAKLRAGTQANYENLGDRDSNTIYLTIE